MKTMFPGWFSMWTQGNSNTFVSSPCWNSYDFPSMIYELYCASQPMRKPRKNASCWWDPESSILHKPKRTCPLKRGHFESKVVFQPLSFQGHVCFLGNKFPLFFVTAFVLCVCTNSFYHSIKIQIPQVLGVFLMDPNSRSGFLPFRLDPLGCRAQLLALRWQWCCRLLCRVPPDRWSRKSIIKGPMWWKT